MGQQKKAAIKVGMVTIGVRLEVAADPEDGGEFKVVCTGKDGMNHDPVRIKVHWDCPTCANRHSSHWGYKDRAAEVDGSLVLVTADQIKAASGAPIKDLTLAFHPREKVYAATLAADSVQNIYPDAGFEKAYAGLAETLAARPDKVAVCIWAPSTKNALWTVEVVDGRLVASKRCWPEDVRPAQAVPMAELTDAERAMFAVFVEDSTTDFDLGRYVNARRTGVRTLLAEQGVSYDSGGTEASSGGDLLAALQASVDALKPPSTARPARKAPAKKTAAKKVAAKKPAAKKTTAKRGAAA